MTRTLSLDGPSLLRGFLIGVGVQRPSISPSTLAEVSPPSTSPSVLAVSSNFERLRPRRSSSDLEIPRPSISLSILAVAGVVPSVTLCTLAVRRPIVPLTLSRAFPVGPLLPRGFPGGPAVADNASSVFKGLVLTAGGEHSSPVVRARAGSAEDCTDPRAGAEKCGYILECSTRRRCNTLINICTSSFSARNLMFRGDGRAGELTTRVFGSRRCYQGECRLFGRNHEFRVGSLRGVY